MHSFSENSWARSQTYVEHCEFQGPQVKHHHANRSQK